MVKRKSRAEIRAADAAGGMSRVEDLRFAGGDWPIHNAIIEWLKNGGAVVLPPVRRRATWRRRVREHALGLLILALVLGWFLGILTSR